jgi:hypothetical protein
VPALRRLGQFTARRPREREAVRRPGCPRERLPENPYLLAGMGAKILCKMRYVLNGTKIRLLRY